jgi:hypothetical protein
VTAGERSASEMIPPISIQRSGCSSENLLAVDLLSARRRSATAARTGASVPVASVDAVVIASGMYASPAVHD